MDSNHFKSDFSHFSAGAPTSADKPKGIDATVWLLRKSGAKLTKEEREATAPLVGQIFVGKGNDGKSRAASILDPASHIPRYLYKPLIDPQIVHMDERGIVLRGYEIEVIDGRSVQYSQAWLIKPLPAKT